MSRVQMLAQGSGEMKKKPNNKTDHTAYQREWRAENPIQVLAARIRSNRRIKEETIKAYGGECYCCGETRLGFLTIDHINNDGQEHRLMITGGKGRNGMNFYSSLRAQGWPDKDILRVACFNCNLGRQYNGGVCPHKDIK